MVDTVIRAQQLGTYNAIDRSRQYEDVGSATLLRQVNEAWSKIRALEKSLADKQDQIVALKGKLKHCNWVRRSLTSMLVYLAFEGAKAIAPMVVRWILTF